MSLLRELQSDFDGALFADSPQDCGRLVNALVGSPAECLTRLGVYRNNLRVGFAKTLALEFPVIQRLVGETYFRQLTQSFMREHPSRCGDLYFIGAPFAAFLRTLFAQTRFGYLADVAALEWEHQRVILAADSGAPDVSILAQLPPELLESIQFALNDACGLVSSAYPILQIWRTNQTETATDEVVDLDDGADRILVRRVRDGTESYRLDSATFTLLQSFSQGRSLGDAFERARDADDGFNLEECLRRYIGLNVISAVRTDVRAARGESAP